MRSKAEIEKRTSMRTCVFMGVPVEGLFPTDYIAKKFEECLSQQVSRQLQRRLSILSLKSILYQSETKAS